MKISYQKKKLKTSLNDASEIKKKYGVNAKRVARRIAEITAAPNLATLIQIPAANCHSLSGKRKNEWALDVSKNDRLIFEIDHDPIPLLDNNSIDTKMVTSICVVEIVDYH
jgi:proteic killer suppression protein